ncbi:hypothetical protein DSL92_03170 [Billgrantia gudaonensis]|uniref:Uncharacterized protein n=1 Tax=Billgrantia gudaonensis TaxID=376427 RepID=A0A432JKP5_9GAMM|nr:hypothetical protein DSL92_03170 [Halomonas gudaonensis]
MAAERPSTRALEYRCPPLPTPLAVIIGSCPEIPHETAKAPGWCLTAFDLEGAALPAHRPLQSLSPWLGIATPGQQARRTGRSVALTGFNCAVASRGPKVTPIWRSTRLHRPIGSSLVHRAYSRRACAANGSFITFCWRTHHLPRTAQVTATASP